MKIETPVLKRLGPIPFWRGLQKCLDELDVMYIKSARKAQNVRLAAEKAKEGEVRKWD